MKIVVPITINPATQVTSNLTEIHPTWVSNTTYVVGNRVVRNNRIYESLINSNLNFPPETNPTRWLNVAPSNATAAFDTSNSTQSTRASSIEFVITPVVTVGSIALINISNANTLQIEVKDSSNNIVYTKSVNLDGSVIGDWFDYFFGEFDQLSDVTLTDIPPYANSSIKITLTGVGDVKIGSIIVGTAYEIGGTQYGVSFGIRDYSVKEEDDFGNTIFVIRNFARRVEPTVFIENSQLRKIDKLLTDIRAKPTVFIPTDIETYQPLITFGYLKDWNIEIPYPNNSLLRLDIQGLT